MDKIAIIINHSSGDQEAEQKLAQLRGAFEGLSVQPEFFLAQGGEGIKLAVQKALGQDYKIICAAGGDGTVNAVASLLLGTRAILGVLPLGTLNHLAKDLGIPDDLPGAVKILCEGQQKAIDVGRVNGKLFLNNSSIGLYPKLVRQKQDNIKSGKSKFIAMLTGMVSVARNYSLLKVRMKINNQDLRASTPFVFVGNNEYEVEGLNFGTRKFLDKSCLSVYVAHRPGVFGLIILALHALKSTLRQHNDFDSYQTKEVFIDSSKKFITVSLDGEIETLPMPLHYEILPQFLKVMAP